jgi:hypothetical protein
MLRQANNQAPITGPAQEQKCAHTTFERTFARSKINYVCVVGPSRMTTFEIRLHH